MYLMFVTRNLWVFAWPPLILQQIDGTPTYTYLRLDAGTTSLWVHASTDAPRLVVMSGGRGKKKKTGGGGDSTPKRPKTTLSNCVCVVDTSTMCQGAAGGNVEVDCERFFSRARCVSPPSRTRLDVTARERLAIMLKWMSVVYIDVDAIADISLTREESNDLDEVEIRLVSS